MNVIKRTRRLQLDCSYFPFNLCACKVEKYQDSGVWVGYFVIVICNVFFSFFWGGGEGKVKRRPYFPWHSISFFVYIIYCMKYSVHNLRYD